MDRISRTSSALLAATLAVGLAACGSAGVQSSSVGQATVSSTPDTGATEVNPPGDIPDNQAFVSYTYDPGGYTVKVPEGWARSSGGGAVTFTDKLNTVRLSSTSASSAPTVASAKSDEVPAIKADQTNVAVQDVTTVDRSAGTAVEIRYLRDGAPSQVTGKTVREAVERYEFYRNGTEAIITLSGPKGADNVDPWRTVTDSFSWQ